MFWLVTSIVLTCDEHRQTCTIEADRLGSISSRVITKTWKTIFTCSHVLGVNGSVRGETHCWAILCQFSWSGQGTLTNFPEISFKLSLPYVMNICKIWMKSVKKWHDYKAF